MICTFTGTRNTLSGAQNPASAPWLPFLAPIERAGEERTHRSDPQNQLMQLALHFRSIVWICQKSPGSGWKNSRSAATPIFGNKKIQNSDLLYIHYLMLLLNFGNSLLGLAGKLMLGFKVRNRTDRLKPVDGVFKE